jgi:hypothetical protein
MKPLRQLLLLLLLVAAPIARASDLSITAANVKATAATSKVSRVPLGETITQGQAVYKKTTDNKYYKADCDAGSGADLAEGIAVTPGGNGEFGYVIFAGPLNIGATLTVGEIYVLSDVAGGVRPKADNGTGDKVTILGVATSSSSLFVNPFASGAAIP